MHTYNYVYVYSKKCFFVRHLFFCTPWPPRMAQRFREVTLLHPTWMYHRKIWAPGHRDTCCRGQVSEGAHLWSLQKKKAIIIGEFHGY